MDTNMEMQKSDFRIIIIDDNPAIHQDFVKILTPIQPTHQLDSLKEKIFGQETKHHMTLPQFQIDTATQGQEGFEKIKAGPCRIILMPLPLLIYVCLRGGMALKPSNTSGRLIPTFKL